MVEPSTANNVATINGNMLGAVGFDTEVLQFIGKDDEPRDVLVTYDSYCSHSMMDSKLAADMGLELEALGNMTTHKFQEFFVFCGRTKHAHDWKRGVSFVSYSAGM